MFSEFINRLLNIGPRALSAAGGWGLFMRLLLQPTSGYGVYAPLKLAAAVMLI